MRYWILAAALGLACGPRAEGDILVSGNEGKYDLFDGFGRIVADAPVDTLSILDFSAFPPRVRTIEGVANSVIGPPSNVAITPDERLVLVANSIREYTDDPKVFTPDDRVFVVRLTGDAPRVVGSVQVGRQPSGISIDRTGRMALVANRADGTVSVLSIDGERVTVRDTVAVGEPGDEVSDVAISPDGHRALVSLNKAGLVRALDIAEGKVTVSDRKLPVYGQPYHVDIMSDGALGLVAGSGMQDGPDADAIAVIDLAANPVRTIDHVAIGTGPESFDVSPDGRLVAVVLMNGSNVAGDHPLRSEQGLLQLLVRDGRTFRHVQEMPIGRIPEGVSFTPDGRYLVVQEHVDRRLALFEVVDDRLRDTGHRIAVPGFPSSLRRANR